MSAVVYADFGCPACYLASLRVDRLVAAGLPAPDWRAVEHRPRLPLTGLSLTSSARTARDQALDRVRLLADPAEMLPARSPDRLPHTGSAVAAYAEAYGVGAADLVRPLLFHAYWVEGRDIGDPEVLRRLLPGALARGSSTGEPVPGFGYAVTSQHGPVTTAAYRRVRQWQQDWLALGAEIALTVATDTDIVTGAAALDALRPPAASGPARLATAAGAR